MQRSSTWAPTAIWQKRGANGQPRCALAAPVCTKVTAAGVMWQTIIHGGFILSAIGIAYTDRLMTNSTAKREHVAH